MPVYNKRGILLLPKVIVLNPKDGNDCSTNRKLNQDYFLKEKYLENLEIFNFKKTQI